MIPKATVYQESQYLIEYLKGLHARDVSARCSPEIRRLDRKLNRFIGFSKLFPKLSGVPQ